MPAGGREATKPLTVTERGPARGFFHAQIPAKGQRMETIPTAADDLRADVIRRVKDEDITFIQLWFTDVVGRLKSFAITQRELEDAVMHGMGFDGSSVTGFNAIEES